MVQDVQPVADVFAAAINRQGFAGDRFDDHQRQQFFGELIGSVVVAAIGHDHGQAVG